MLEVKKDVANTDVGKPTTVTSPAQLLAEAHYILLRGTDQEREADTISSTVGFSAANTLLSTCLTLTHNQPDHIETYSAALITLSALEVRLGNRDAAITLLKTALDRLPIDRVDPHVMNAHRLLALHLGHLYHHAGNHVEAAFYYDWSDRCNDAAPRELGQQQVPIFFERGMICLENYDYSPAREHLTAVVLYRSTRGEFKKEQMLARAGLAVAEFFLGYQDSAHEFFREATQYQALYFGEKCGDLELFLTEQYNHHKWGKVDDRKAYLQAQDIFRELFDILDIDFDKHIEPVGVP